MSITNYININLYDFSYLTFEGIILFLILVNIIKISKFNLKTGNSKELQYAAKITLENVTTNLFQVIIGSVAYSLTIFFLKNEENVDIFSFFRTYFVENSKVIAFHSFVIVDFYTNFFKLIILISFLIILLSSAKYVEFSNKPKIEFPILTLGVCFFLFTLISSNNLISAFISVVGFSLNIYVLILTNTDDTRTREAGIKYYYLSANSSGYLLIGVFLAYLIFQTTSITSITYILQNVNFSHTWVNDGLMIAMFLFLVFGFFFKLGAYPGHFWVSEVYDGAPQFVMAIFVLPVKIGVLAFVFKLFIISFSHFSFLYSPIFFLSAIWSMIFGALLAISEKKLRKFLAFSSINQMGFLITGIVACNPKTLVICIFYLLIYVVMNMILFIVLLNTFEIKSNRPMYYLSDLTSIIDKKYGFKILLTVVFFSMAGIPPLAGFFSKYYLFLSLFENQRYVILIVGLITTMISTYYYLKIIVLLNFVKKNPDLNFDINTNSTTYFIIILLNLFLIAFSFFANTICEILANVLSNIDNTLD